MTKIRITKTKYNGQKSLPYREKHQVGEVWVI